MLQSNDIWQLSVLLFALIVTFFSIVILEKRTVATVILLLIPFQLVENRFGTSSIALAYFAAAALYIRGWKIIPFPLPILSVICAFVISFIFSVNKIDMLNLFYIINFFSGFAILYIFYNLASIYGEDKIEKQLIVLNALVLVYCALQMLAGPGNSYKPFGLEFFEFHTSRGGNDPRLVGPFGSPGATATFLLLMSLICLRALHRNPQVSSGLAIIVLALNLATLSLTGNRSGLILAVFGALCYFGLVARDLLPQIRIAGVAAILVMASGLVSFISVSSSFNTIADRMEKLTETSDGLPETRARVWTEAWEKIKNRPWTGDGPYLLYQEQAEQLGLLRTRYDNFPHSLYLYLLRTVGVIGLIAFIYFFASIFLVKAKSLDSLGPCEFSRSRFLKLLTVVFLINQVFLEFMRISFMDLVQFVFLIFGIYTGVLHASGKNNQSENVV